MKHLNKTIQIIVFITSIISSKAYAQEFSFDLSGQFKTDQDSNNYGGGLSLGLNYNINPNLSVNSGLGISKLFNRKSLNTFSDSDLAIDQEGETFEFQYTVNNFLESNSYTALIIPLTFQYETLGDIRFFVRAGGSYTLPFTGKTEANTSRINTSGFYERFNATLVEPRFAGFGEFNNINFQQQDLKLKESLNLLFETGVAIRQKFMSEKFSYLSIFTEIGVNQINEETTNGLLTYNTQNPTEFITTSVINANNDNINDKTKLIFIGIRLRIDI